MAVEEETLTEYKLFNVRKLASVDVEKDLEWICRSFGFLEPRDRKKTAYRVFRAIIEAARTDAGLSSNELAEKLALSRGTIVHHLNKMMKSGLVIYHEGQYKLRGRNLATTIEEIQLDTRRVFDNLRDVSKTIDDRLNLLSR
jgi:biotin operon repressor